MGYKMMATATGQLLFISSKTVATRHGRAGPMQSEDRDPAATQIPLESSTCDLRVSCDRLWVAADSPRFAVLRP